MFTVTDVKQYFYCPRVPFYAYCLSDVRPKTDKMEAGRAAHEVEALREHRRSLQPYDVKAAERQFDVALASEALGLSGQIDLVLLDPDGESGAAWPVDFKFTPRKGPHFELQLVAYALLLEECWERRVDRGFLYLIPLRLAEPVRITTAAKRRVRAALAQMQQMIVEERLPAPPKTRAKCLDCEFRRFCNDV